MIRLTRLNGRPFVLNTEQIKTVESTPDTMLTLLNGDQFVVREPIDLVIRRAVEYARTIRSFQWNAPDPADPADPAQHPTAANPQER